MSLINDIKESEGFVDHVYQDHLGNDTIGYGSLMPLIEEECELILKYRLDKMIKHLTEVKPIVKQLSEKRQEVLYEMSYQMGVSGLLKFKKMWEALQNNDFKEASIQMLDSKWSKQTPNRALRLSKKMI